MFLNGLMSVFDALDTVPIGMPRGNIDGSEPLPSVPAVMIVSPTPTYALFGTRSRMSDVAATAAALDVADGGRVREVGRCDGALSVR